MSEPRYLAVQVDGARRMMGGYMDFVKGRRVQLEGTMMRAADYFLKAAGFEILVPCQSVREFCKNRWIEKDERLLFNLVLVKGAEWAAVRDIPHVRDFIKDADGKEAMILEKEIAHLIAKPGEKAKPKIMFLKGDRVRVKPGHRLEGRKFDVVVHKVNQRKVTLDGPNGSVRLSDSVVERI